MKKLFVFLRTKSLFSFPLLPLSPLWVSPHTARTYLYPRPTVFFRNTQRHQILWKIHRRKYTFQTLQPPPYQLTLHIILILRPCQVKAQNLWLWQCIHAFGIPQQIQCQACTLATCTHVRSPFLLRKKPREEKRPGKRLYTKLHQHCIPYTQRRRRRRTPYVIMMGIEEWAVMLYERFFFFLTSTPPFSASHFLHIAHCSAHMKYNAL